MAYLTPDEQRAVARLAFNLAPALCARGGAATTERGAMGGGLRGLERWRDGDEPRHIDWRARLRTGALFVRRFEAEGDERLVVAVDSSASMGARKLRAACRLAAGLSVVAATRGVSLVLVELGARQQLLYGDGIERLLPRAEDALDRLRSVGATPLAEQLGTLRGHTNARDSVVVLTDFADPEPLVRTLGVLRSATQSCRTVLGVLAESSDEELPLGEGELAAIESREVRRLGGSAEERRRFALAVRAWREQIGDAALRYGMGFVAATAPLDGELVNTVAALLHALVDVPRRNGP